KKKKQMVAEVVDYRVSRLVVLCKDCGHDVGLYPARHKCKISDANAPPLPSMSKQYLSSNNPNSSNDDNNSQSSSLWSKLKNVNNWKEMAEDDSVKPSVSQFTTSAKLWDKLLKSEKDDWEGETHISRILREYHQQKPGDIPDWLYDPKPILPQSDSTKNKNNIPPPNRIPVEGYKNSLPNNSTPYQSNDNDNRGRKPRTYDENDALLTQNSSTNFSNRNRNHVPSTRVYPPSDDVVKLSSKKSHQLLRVNPTENSIFNRARSVSPNPFRNRNANKSNKQSKGYKQ
ncbi:6317_t:CDS:2, partial [Gigaspora rosea]